MKRGPRTAGSASGPPFEWTAIDAPPDGLDDSLNVLAAFLTRYSPPSAPWPAAGGWEAVYDLIEWEGTFRGIGAPFLRSNRVVGRRVVTRHPDGSGGRIEYRLDQVVRIEGFESALAATARCLPGAIPDLEEWELRYECRPPGASAAHRSLVERGRHLAGAVEIRSPAGLRRLAAAGPVTTQWGVLDGLRTADFAGDSPAFDLLHDLTSFRPRQRLKPSGAVIADCGGERLTLRGYVQCGAGSMPTHYWLDAGGRPLLVTEGLLSSALSGIRPA